MMIELRIENWAVVTPALDPWAAPETQRLSLNGNVFGHPRFDDGAHITTSSIIGKNNEDEILTHSGSAYKLGQVNPDYEAKFPGARDRFLGSFK